jgi:heat shock protein HslJ
LTFEPGEPQQINISEGETAKVEYSARPTRRVWIGGELTYPYTVTVQASNQQTRTLEGSLAAKGLLPVWAAIAGAAALLLACLCLCLASGLTLRGGLRDLTSTKTPELTSTATVLLPTATQSQTDQKPLLVERNWYLVSYNDTRSSPGTQEPYNLFNPDGTLIGFTGCKDLSANYQTNFNQISISNLSLGRGTCPDATLQQQEDAFVAILRSARSYFVADTALQIAGEAGFLNYSLSSLDRPEEFPPPTAVIRAVPQSEAGQVVVFDGAASSGQVPIVSWKWDFGDGENASGAVVQHIYRNPGMYTASLTVTDQRGQTGSAAHQIHVLAQPLPTAQPTLPPPTAPPAQPTPTAEPQPEPPTATPEIPPEPATATPEPQPEPDPPQASISGPREGYIGEPVVFDASSSRPGGSPIVSYAWSFGNGQDQPASPDPSASTIYNQAGDYEVTVFVSDANGLSSNASTRIVIGARLDTAVWTLSGFNGQPLLPGTAITLQFLQGQLSGFAGCNTYNGGYTASDNGDGTYSVTIDRVSASRLSCPADLMAQESSYLTALQQATSAAVQENRLTLNYPNGALVFYLVSPQ